MAFALLPSLHPRDRHAVIRVRVCRKWEFRAHGTDDGSIIHIDLVLADEKGNSMYAEIPTTEIERKGSLVQEGGIYVVSRFMVSNAKNTFMPVPGNYMIEFTYHTMVTPVTDTTLAIPELIYHLTPFGDLEQRAGVHSHFTDVLGVLIQVSDARAVHLTGRPNPTITRDIVLRDLSYFEIKVSLWGHRASAFTIDTIHNPSESKPIVVLLVGTVVKTFQGQHYLSAGAACRWFFNPPIPEADVFYNSLNDQRIEIRHSAATVSEPRGLALAQAEITTLGQLDAMDTYTIGDACYRCTVVIARLVPGERWWFPSCARCNKSCMQETSGYKCRICLSTVYKFKYKLAFVATDGTAEAKMVSFDNVATRIIGKPVQQLMRAGRPTEDFPPDIAAVVSLKFTFAIALSDQSFKSPEKSYRVLSVLATHGRQISVPRLVITASTSGVQAQAIDSHQQQPALRGGTLEVSAETEMPKDTAEQQAAATLPETTFKMLEVQPQPSHDTPAASNIQGTPPDTNTAAHSAKKDLTKYPYSSFSLACSPAAFIFLTCRLFLLWFNDACCVCPEPPQKKIHELPLGGSCCCLKMKQPRKALPCQLVRRNSGDKRHLHHFVSERLPVNHKKARPWMMTLLLQMLLQTPACCSQIKADRCQPTFGFCGCNTVRTSACNYS